MFYLSHIMTLQMAGDSSSVSGEIFFLLFDELFFRFIVSKFSKFHPNNRHGAAYFLKKLGYPTNELCLYTEASPGDVQIPLQKWVLESFEDFSKNLTFRLFKKMEGHDMQNGGLLYQLYRNSCKFDSRYLKDLGILGRDLKNVSLYFSLVTVHVVSRFATTISLFITSF